MKVIETGFKECTTKILYSLEDLQKLLSAPAGASIYIEVPCSGYRSGEKIDIDNSDVALVVEFTLRETMP